jgi:N-acetylglucosaminyldiphosphoundecaprenol N-acetyl-beta-D-mannosaminyltransferase
MDKLLGVKIDNLTQTEIRQKVESFLVEDGFHQIATINPEFILEAQKNSEFKNILNSCDLNIADGFGLKLAFWRYGKILKYRLTGADLMDEILRIANERKLSVFLAANKNGLSSWEKTRDAISKKYPGLEIAGENINILDTKYQILNTKYQILFCNFGAPFQEIFLNSLKNGKIKLAMGVGGSFDYLTGKIFRAPQFLRHIGLEWLWRLVLQPQRWKRILNATLVFPMKIILSKEK